MSYRTSVVAADFHSDTRAFFAGRTVAVTGGSGFIGSHVVEQLLDLGARPIVVSRRSAPPFLAGVRESIELRRADLEDFASTREALRGASCILSLAAQVGGIEYNAAHHASIFTANLTSFMNVMRSAVEQRVDRFLVTSSACVYPRDCSIPTPEAEGTKDEPEPTNGGYGWAKRMEEYLGAQWAKEAGLSVAIARPYNAYGPRDEFDPTRSHVIPALILKAFRSTDGTLPVWGSGQQSRSFLYVDDFARGLLEVAARYPAADPVNLGADEETTIGEASAIIAEVVSELRATPIRPVFQGTGLTGQPRRRCDTKKVEALLGWQAKMPFREGLVRTIHWFRDNEDHALSAHA